MGTRVKLPKVKPGTRSGQLLKEALGRCSFWFLRRYSSQLRDAKNAALSQRVQFDDDITQPCDCVRIKGADVPIKPIEAHCPDLVGHDLIVPAVKIYLDAVCPSGMNGGRARTHHRHVGLVHEIRAYHHARTAFLNFSPLRRIQRHPIDAVPNDGRIVHRA